MNDEETGRTEARSSTIVVTEPANPSVIAMHMTGLTWWLRCRSSR